jgi:DNA-binding MarR family transcriptional regulator
MATAEIRPLSHAADVATTWKRERPDLDLTGFLLSIYVMRLGRVMEDTYDRMCRKRFGISGADMRVLFALRRAGEPFSKRPTDLYRALLVTSGAITKQVDRLSKLGFVQRLIADANSKSNLVRLTSKGLKTANTAFEFLAKESIIAQAIESLSAPQRTSAYAFCEHMLQQMELLSKEAPATGADPAKVRRPPRRARASPERSGRRV